jgi:hypothetical protein
MKNGKLQAKDLDDCVILREVHRQQYRRERPAGSISPEWPYYETPHWVTRWDLAVVVYNEAPERVLLAKLASLIRRGLMTGCACGCRGDLEITPAGERLIGSDPQ